MFGIEAYGNEGLYWLLFGVFALICVYVWSGYSKQARMDAFAHIESMKKIADSISVRKTRIKQSMVCAAFLLIVFALMRPQGEPDQQMNDPKDDEKKDISSSLSLQEIKSQDGEGKKVMVRDSARDVIFLLDVSASMGAEDLYPNRLERAKDMIRDTIGAMRSEHIGLVIFTSIPSVKCVLTLDHTYFKQVLSEVRINDNDYAGTKFTPALTEIIDRQFDFSDNKFKDLIVITDGGDTDLEGLSGDERTRFEQQFFDLVKSGYEEKGIRIHTIGLGTRAGSVIQGVKDENGNPVKSSLNEAFLQGLSKNAHGIYVSAADSNVDMKRIYETKIANEGDRDLQKEREIEVDEERLKELVQKQREKEEQKVVYKELYVYALLPAILLLCIEVLVSTRKRKRREPVT